MIGFALLFVVAFVGWLVLERSMDGSATAWNGWSRTASGEAASGFSQLKQRLGIGAEDQERQLAAIDAEAEALEAEERELAAERLPTESVASEPEPIQVDLEVATAKPEPSPEPPAPLRSKAKKKTPAKARVEPDDLKEIRGIGPVIEESLNEIGVVTFEDLAGMTPEQVEQIGEMLGGFKNRMKRDGWVQQARKLARAKTV